MYDKFIANFKASSNPEWSFSQFLIVKWTKYSFDSWSTEMSSRVEAPDDVDIVREELLEND